MKIGLMTASFLGRKWEEALDLASANGLEQIEACAGGYIPKVHFDPVQLVESDRKLSHFKATLASRSLDLVALSCHGNPLHPDRAVSGSAHADFEATCELARRLGVRFVNVLAGCPGGAPSDEAPNWIIPSVVPDLREQYRWQWEERVGPYWTEALRIADARDVTVCIEPHPSTVVFNVETFEKLRAVVGAQLGMNYDHSHLWWQGIEPVLFIQRCGESIRTVHFKDTVLNAPLIAELGVLSGADYDEMDRRPWCYGTPGFGHSELTWAEILLALKKVGFEGPLTIECEDPFIDPVDTLRHAKGVLDRVMPRLPKPAMDWPNHPIAEDEAER